jgi:hypothetical protein
LIEKTYLQPKTGFAPGKIKPGFSEGYQPQKGLAPLHV